MEQKHLVVGILAHVDAGKTTLAESILYASGTLRKLGRVDHGDTFLDNYALERSRGITIFSKQAEFQWKEKNITLLDTPGHVDFSAEMERTLQVLDYAILVISGTDGVQSHVQTLWKLLKRYEIPVFLFINKMDRATRSEGEILAELKERLDEKCIDFSEAEIEELTEHIALCNEILLEKFINEQEISVMDIAECIRQRVVFPCFFGSALKSEGVQELLNGVDKYSRCPCYSDVFGAKVYKISRDKQGMRLTHLKVTGGCLKTKMPINEEEKIDQIRIYFGTSYTTVTEVPAGCICAVSGLSNTKAGAGLGQENDSFPPVLEPVLTYQILLPEENNIHDFFVKLKQLEEEEPELHIVWNDTLNQIHVQVMGEVQIEVLQKLIAERYDTEVTFGVGNIVYKETIAAPTYGAGHYEPLRHYAEVRLLLEPTERGSGLSFATNVNEDILDKNWQRLILTHLEERQHKGVLTGSEITDMKITLINGRAHIKHTEGGDFRQATYRAVRQGLKQATSILLEPVYEFQLEVPQDMIGRAMSDVQRMQGTFELPEISHDMALLHGTAPVVQMQNYQKEVIAYTKGAGSLSYILKGYEPCQNAEEIITAIHYDSEADTENPTGSIFCSRGAGFNVPWDEVDTYMHTENPENKKDLSQFQTTVTSTSQVIDDAELEAIFLRTYGANKRDGKSYAKTVYTNTESKKTSKKGNLEEVLLVDGYNIIFAWEELKELAEINLEGARGKLADILCNFQGYRKNHVILVFDGYKVPGNLGEVSKYHNIYIIYTKEAETADQYIEKTVADISKKYDVRVATSDMMEQMIILGQGARRISAKELFEEIQCIRQQIKELYLEGNKKVNPYLFDSLSENMAEFIDDVRLGRRTFEEVKSNEHV